MLQEMSIDRKSGKPVSEQIADFVRNKIERKEIMTGERLPPTQDLVNLTGIGSQTIRKAMKLLEAEGFIESSRGRGTFVKEIIKDSTVKKLAMLGAFSDIKNTYEILYPVTMAGAFKECEKRKISAHIYPPYIDTSNPSEVLKILKQERCEGILWFYPSAEDLKTLELIKEFKIPVVIASPLDIFKFMPCVECDDITGSNLLANFYIEQGCKRVFVFREILTQHLEQRRHGDHNWMDNLKKSVSFCFKNNTTIGSKISLENVELPYKSPEQYKIQFKEQIKNLHKGDGILVENSEGFREILLDKQICDILSNLKIAVITLENCIDNLKPLTITTSFKMLVLPVQKIGKAMVQKLLAEEYDILKESITYIPVEIKDSFEIF